MEKFNVVKTYALSKIVFPLTVLEAPDEIVKRLKEKRVV